MCLEISLTAFFLDELSPLRVAGHGGDEEVGEGKGEGEEEPHRVVAEIKVSCCASFSLATARAVRAVMS